MARPRANADKPKLAALSDWSVQALPHPVPHGLKRAIEYIRGHLNGKISIADIVAHCGVPERTLRKHFRAFIGVSPLCFSRRLRLAAARACLVEGLNGTSITEVAARFGFGHFGRFAQDYRQRFGEAPSETLRRSHTESREQESRHRDHASATPPSRTRDRPSIAILPLQNSAIDPDCRALGEYIAEDIATVLCRVRSLSVTVRNCPRVRMPDPRQESRDVGTRYLLSGRIAQSGNRVRVIIHLFDAETEVRVWGDTYDGLIEDLFGLADRITEGVMQAIPPHIRGSEIERSRRKRPESLAAYGLTMRAFPFVFASNPAAARQGLELLSRAIEIEPDYAPATALAAWCHAQLILYDGTPSPNQERRNALLLGERAGILDPDDPIVLTARCAVHTMAGQLDRAAGLIARALELDPTLVWAWERSGWLNAYAGNAETAIKRFDQATRLDPRRPNANRLTGLGCAYFHACRYDEAALWKRAALREDAGTAWINRSLSVTYARLGDRLAALDSLEALRRYSPDITIGKVMQSLPFTQDFLDRVADGLDDLGLSA